MENSSAFSNFDNQKVYFRSNATRSAAFRKESLRKLLAAMKSHENDILAALGDDLGKSRKEAYLSEVGLVESEIKAALKNIDSWMKPRKVRVPPALIPAKACIRPEPYGVALIIGPWNYPFQLLFSPLIGAIAAGNCVTLKPSEYAPKTSEAILELIGNTFDPQYISAVQGDAEFAAKLIDMNWDYLFFTGGIQTGKKVMSAASKHLTPLTLELGGKSPCVVDEQINLKVTARRIIWGKFFNAGQTCIAPDYLLVNENVVESLIPRLISTIEDFYGVAPEKCADYGRIINETHFERLNGLLDNQKIIHGGKCSKNDLFISPTLIGVDSWDNTIMQDEIFGPILPILTYKDLNDAIEAINSRPKPLALYLFSKDENVQKTVLERTSSGGVCINDTINHIVPHNLPFGGVGHSGMGKYHGETTFKAFSHEKSILNKSFRFDFRFRYVPYRFPFSIARYIIRFMTR